MTKTPQHHAGDHPPTEDISELRAVTLQLHDTITSLREELEKKEADAVARVQAARAEAAIENNELKSAIVRMRVEMENQAADANALAQKHEAAKSNELKQLEATIKSLRVALETAAEASTSAQDGNRGKASD